MLAIGTRVAVEYPNSSHGIYNGNVEKDDGVNLTVKLLDQKDGKDQFRSFLKLKIRNLTFPR